MASTYSKASGAWTAPVAIDGNIAGAPGLPHLSVSANGNMLVTWRQDSRIYARRFLGGAWDTAGTAIPVLSNGAGNLLQYTVTTHTPGQNNSFNTYRYGYIYRDGSLETTTAGYRNDGGSHSTTNTTLKTYDPNG